MSKQTWKQIEGQRAQIKLHLGAHGCGTRRPEGLNVPEHQLLDLKQCGTARSTQARVPRSLDARR
jgi:hypothetical protein